MRRVAVDVEANVATVEGGATAGDLASACTPYGLVAVTGAAASVGVVGLTLGGGYGPLSPKYGLAVDNLVGCTCHRFRTVRLGSSRMALVS
jgi:FAD/FMN-containing dehydrogenase